MRVLSGLIDMKIKLFFAASAVILSRYRSVCKLFDYVIIKSLHCIVDIKPCGISIAMEELRFGIKCQINPRKTVFSLLGGQLRESKLLPPVCKDQGFVGILNALELCPWAAALT